MITVHGKVRPVSRSRDLYRLNVLETTLTLTFGVLHHPLVQYRLTPRHVVQTVCVKPKFHYADFATKSLSPTFLVHYNGQNSIRATRTGLSRTCHGLCRKHLDMSRWFVSATFMICVYDFPRGKVSVKVGVMEFGLYTTKYRMTDLAHILSIR